MKKRKKKSFNQNSKMKIRSIENTSKFNTNY